LPAVLAMPYNTDLSALFAGQRHDPGV